MKWRAFRTPSFEIAFLGSLAVWLVFVVWILLDASFDRLLEQIRVNLRFDGDPGNGFFGVYNGLGRRMLLFAVLAFLAAASTLLVLGRLIVGSREGRSWPALLFAVALMGLWVLLLNASDSLAEAGVRVRVRRALPALKADAAILVADWPTTEGSLPFAGQYLPLEESNLLRTVFESKKTGIYPMNEFIGPCIWSTEGGGLRFDCMLTSSVAAIEFCPQNRLPASFKHAFKYHGRDLQTLEHVMKKYVELEPDWFLVWYAVHDLGHVID